MIVATAGHVDHGKTSLVRALTGVDTDTLAEERRRGMTIEPGFAHLDLEEGGTIGFVDVPGHERFVRHMLAGVAAVDAALLVVAVDDGPMPQTHEHLGILDLLGVSRGVVALTKIDRVAPARVAQVAAEVQALLALTTLRGAPLFPLSASSGAGVAALRSELVRMQRMQPAARADGHFRLAVDRCFTRAGAGRVVTGAVLSGRIQAGQVVLACPSGASLRVRAVQVHGREVGEGRAGERCALNLADAGGGHAEVGRGDWIVAPDVHRPTLRLDAWLRLLPPAAQPAAVRPGSGALGADIACQLHIGAATRSVRAVPLQAGRLDTGASGWVQLVLEAPVGALRGDRFILRDAAARRIIGGGRVIDPFAPARGRMRPQRLADLEALAADAPQAALAALLEAHPEGLEWRDFALGWNLGEAAAAALRDGVAIQRIVHRGGERMLDPRHWQRVLDRIDQALADWHAGHPDSVGLAESALASALGLAADPVLRQAALRSRIDAGAVVREGLWLRLATHRARLGAEDQALLQRVATLLESFGLRPPPLGELAPQLSLEPEAAAAFLQRSAALGHLVQVAKNRWFLPATFAALVRIARQVAAEAPDGRFDARSFRDRSGIGRNLTIQLLEYFDRVGITRFAGERRTIAPLAADALVDDER